MNSTPYERGQWAVSVADAQTGEQLVGYNTDVLLEPASVTKTYSSAGVWTQFGPDWRTVTPVVRTGRVVDGDLRGDLVLVAKGDITMGGQTGSDGRVVFANWDHNDANSIPGMQLADNRPLAGLRDLARQVRAAGIRSVTGQVVIDDRLFRTEALGIDGPVSPIVINNNLIDVLTTPTTVGRTAKVVIRPVVAPWTVDNRTRTVKAGGATQVDVAATPAGVLRVTGTVAADADPVLRVYHLREPARFARSALIQELERAGVRVRAATVGPNPAASLPSSAAVRKLPVVARLRSLPLSEQARYVLKVSYNRGAQTFVCLLAVAAGSRDCDAGFPVLAMRLADLGVDPAQATLVDGSGLPGNYVTARSATELMVAFAARPDWAVWRDALPVMGRDGSLVNVQADSPAAGHVFAKTGTLGAADLLNSRLRLETKALSGYVQAKSGRWLAVAIIVNQSVFDDIQGVFAANEDLGKIASSIWADY